MAGHCNGSKVQQTRRALEARLPGQFSAAANPGGGKPSYGTTAPNAVGHANLILKSPFDLQNSSALARKTLLSHD